MAARSMHRSHVSQPSAKHNTAAAHAKLIAVDAKHMHILAIYAVYAGCSGFQPK